MPHRTQGRLILFQFSLLLLFSSGAFAQTRYWVGGTGGNWDDPANWAIVSGGAGPASVPTAGFTAVFDANTGSGVVTLRAAVTIASLRMEGFEGTLDLQGFTLTVTQSGLFQTGVVDNAAPGISILRIDNAVSVRFDGTSLGVPVEGTVEDIYFDGSEFTQRVSLTKTGAQDNYSDGGNLFRSTVSITNAGAGSVFHAFNFADVHLGAVELINTGSASIRLAVGSFNTRFSDDVTVSCTSGQGVFLGDLGFGGAVFDAGAQLAVGAGGFTTGELMFHRTAFQDVDPLTLSLTGGASLVLGLGTTFSGPVNFSAPRVFLGGVNFLDTATLTKTGSSVDFGFGGARFAGTATINNTGSGLLFLSNVDADRFEGSVEFNNSGAGAIYPSYAGSSNRFFGTVSLSNPSGTGIIFGFGGGTSQVETGASLQVGSGGFAAGRLELNRVTQSDAALQQSVVLTGTALLTVANSNFFGSVDFRAPQLEVAANTFRQTTRLEKTGSVDNFWGGGNRYVGAATIVNAGSSSLVLARYVTGDQYQASATFVNAGGGGLFPSYGFNDTFAGDIRTDSPTPVIFGFENGRVTLTGGQVQNLVSSPGVGLRMQRLTVNKSANQVVLQSSLQVALSAVFTNGVVVATAASPLLLNDNVVVAGASASSFVDGPIQKFGNDAFTFPVGDDGFYRPITISAPANITDQFTAQYVHQRQNFGGTYEPGLARVSGCEYWSLVRNSGATNVRVTLSWLEAACLPGDITLLPDLRVAQWTGTLWANRGNGGTTGTTSAGTVISGVGAITGFSTEFFTLASVSTANPLPVELSSFMVEATLNGNVLSWVTQSELNNDYFVIERADAKLMFDSLGSADGAGTRSEASHYRWVDARPPAGGLYYRLRQVDLDGRTSFSQVIRLNVDRDKMPSVYPNPVADYLYLPGPGPVRVYDIRNQCVWSGEGRVIDVQRLPAGAYVLVHGDLVYRFVKQ